MRVVCRIAERLVDSLLELHGDHVLEAVGLVVDVVDVEPEGVCQVQLEQAMVADHLERHLGARRCEARASAAVGLVLEQVEHGELLEHHGRRGRRHALVVRDGGDGRATACLLELVDALEVVLDRLGERRPGHGASVAASSPDIVCDAVRVCSGRS